LLSPPTRCGLVRPEVVDALRAHAELLAYFAGVEQSSQHRIGYRVAVHPLGVGTEPAAAVARYAVAAGTLSLGDDLP
jgi:hypothetical protein